MKSKKYISDKEIKIKKNGKILVKKNNDFISLTSSFNIENEEKRFLDKIKTDIYDNCIIILGVGRGKWINSSEIDLLLKNKNKIIIIEPSYKIYMQYKSNYYNSNIQVIYNNIKKSLLHNLIKNNLDNLKLLVYGNYGNCFKNCYELIKKTIGRYKILRSLNYNTYRRFIKKMIQNNAKNIFNNSFIKINNYKNVYKNIPGLIVSAGPSLKKNLYTIKKFDGIIVTGVRTLSLLQKNNINPDFVLNIDPVDISYDLVKKSEHNIPLVCIPKSNSKLISKYRGKKILVNSKGWNKNNKFLKSSLDTLDSGGSVSNFAFSFLKYIGCSSIIFTGQDLSKDKKNNDYISGADQNKGEYADNEYFEISIKGYNGEKIITKPNWFSFLQWFENEIENYKGQVFNCTEGGAFIKGAKHIPFQEYLDIEKKEINYIKKDFEQDFKLTNREKKSYYKKIKKLNQEVFNVKEKLSYLYENHTLMCLNNKKSKEYLENINHQIKTINKKIYNYPLLFDIFNFHKKKLIKSKRGKSNIDNKDYIENLVRYFEGLHMDIEYYTDEMKKWLD